MRRSSFAVAALSLAVSAGIASLGLRESIAQEKPAGEVAAKPQAAQVPVKQVVLYSSGVGYFEHSGSVQGNGSTELQFKTQQVNDILKSLVLQDLDGGKVSTVTYPSLDPLSKTLQSFQVDISKNPPLADLLNQLRGAVVTVKTAGADTIRGTILGVEKKKRPVGKEEKEVVEVAVLNVLSNAMIQSVSLDEVRDLQLEDPQLREELTKALTAVAQARGQDKKPVVINFRGDGERRVRIGYVVETPIWKTSYRLILPKEGEKAQGNLQGWAIVENQTDSDWTDVNLSLVSGRPISFIQDLYAPLYVQRPVVEPELYASLRPQTYDAAMREDKAAVDFAAKKPARALLRAAAAQPAAAPAEVATEMAVDSVSRADAPMDVSASVQSIASAAKVGELFQYNVGNVSLPRQKSAMLPIVTDPVEVERVSIYNQGVLPKNPLNGARVKNTTGKHLLQGPITVLETGSYAGDARIDDVPPGQERLLSYGVDQQILVDATKNRSESAIVSGKIVKGVLQLSMKDVLTQEYLSENKGDREKTMIIEHPIRGDWKLLEPAKADETTEQVYRFKGTVAPGKPSKLTVKQEHVRGEVIEILPADIGQLAIYAKSGSLSKEVRDALTKAIAAKQAMEETRRQIGQKQQRISEITQEQNRIRENMKTVAQNNEYYQRLLKKLDEQESSIEKLQLENDSLEQTLEKQRVELENALNNQNIG